MSSQETQIIGGIPTSEHELDSGAMLPAKAWWEKCIIPFAVVMVLAYGYMSLGG